LRANYSRECVPDARLREAIHQPQCRWIASVATAPRNDGGEKKQPPALLPTAVSHRKTVPFISDI
jgi:hypothetical protein